MTMLFTDIEGSTRLARALGSGWRDVLGVHHRLLGGAIAQCGGEVERTEGDSFFALFDGPDAALAAAVAGQRALANHPWPPELGELKVRMGLHTGKIEGPVGDLVGLDIHLAARVESAANGGQVVITDATRRAATEPFDLAGLGEHRLKDFPKPERLWLVKHDERGPDDFPALRTEPVRPTNLWADPRRLVGREEELAWLGEALMGEDRLVTVLGIGGTGKTRLAVAAAHAHLNAFEGGVWLISLAGVTDPGVFMPTIATTLDVGDSDAATLDEAVAGRLRARPTLLVLDNFEQLVDAAGLITALLGEAPKTRVLVTSQLPLRIAHERILRLEPLPRAAAVALFDQRAGLASPGFELERHRAEVESICARLEGMPLAIELAAARVATLAPAQVLARLDQSLRLLVRGPRDLPERHRTLRAALDWTAGLLAPDEQVLLARSAAFAGPVPFDALEAVAAVAPAVDALEALSGLVDASFVRRVDTREHGVRYTLAQAVRDFAAERLAASGEEREARLAQAAYVAAIGRRGRAFGALDPGLEELAGIEAELRPALDWTRAHAPDEHARIAGDLGVSMYGLGRAREVWTELGIAIERVGVDDPVGGWAAIVRGYAGVSLAYVEEARGLMLAGVAAARAADDPLQLELTLRLAGLMSGFMEEPERGLAYATEALELARRSGDPELVIPELCYAAQALTMLGRLDEAERMLDEAESIPRRASSHLSVATHRADIALKRQDWAQAAREYAGSARDARASSNQLVGDLRCAAYCLLELGADEGGLEIDAVAAAITEETGQIGVEDHYIPRHRSLLEQARHNLDPDRVASVVARGRRVPASEAAVRAGAIVETYVTSAGADPYAAPSEPG